MNEADRTYELLDFGRGRKLERFGPVVVVRPAPGADADPGLGADDWEDADAEFEREGRNGRWRVAGPLPDPWVVRSGDAEFLLEPTPAGKVGLFPEQEPLRSRIGAAVRAVVARGEAPPKVLDLFGHTGGSAMAAAKAGAEVTTVDAARAAIRWARRNFARNGLENASIRSIQEDVGKFVEREGRRGTRYDAVVLDPPSFGRGPKGRVWKIERDLERLLAACRAVLLPRPMFVLTTAHTESWRMGRLAGILERAMNGTAGVTTCGDLALRTRDGRGLRSGIYALREFR